MCQLKLWVFVLGVAVNGAVGRSFRDSHPQEDVGIIGGDEVAIEDFPHQVSLVYKGGHICGGSIISEQYVLTAAHCVDKKIASDFQVRVGSSYRTRGGELHDVASITQHPQYNVNEFDYDVAVMRIAKGIVVNGVTTDYVRLPHPARQLRSGDPMTVTGWGYTSWFGKPSNVLKAAVLPVLDKDQCSELWEGVTITDRMVCAGSKGSGHSACRGDSGGPLIDSNYVQYGIVSFGDPLCQLRPTVFASVANLRHWIQQHTGV